MRLALYFFLSGTFARLSFVSCSRNVTLDDNDPAIIYSPGWSVSSGNNSLDFGGSLHFNNNATASASLTFQGVAVYLMAPFWSSSVGAQVAIDDQEPFVIDLQDYGVAVQPGLGQETLQSQVVWAVTELPNAHHTLVISMPAQMQHVVLDGLLYSVVDEDNTTSILATGPSTSSSFTTTTTTETFASSSSSSFRTSSFVRPTTTSSSPPPSSSNSSNSSQTVANPTTDVPINVATISAPSSSVGVVEATKVLSASTRRSIAIGSIFGATLLILVLITLLTCLHRRRIRKRKEQTYVWSQKFTPYTSRAASTAPRRPSPRRPSAPRSPFQYDHSPSTAVPLLPPAPSARRMARSPLATAPPIMPPSPSPSTAQFPAPLVQLARPPSPMPTTPLPATPLPPATPGTPWSIQKSQRFSGSSTYSYASSSAESGGGYGWTTPSLVGIHPFSAPAPPEPSSSGSTSRATDIGMAPLTPRLNEKSAAALFRSAGTDTQRLSAAPAYQEKDARRLFAVGRPRVDSEVSQTAPPLYEP